MAAWTLPEMIAQWIKFLTIALDRRQGGSMVLSAEFGKQTLGIPGIFA